MSTIDAPDVAQPGTPGEAALNVEPWQERSPLVILAAYMY